MSVLNGYKYILFEDDGFTDPQLALMFPKWISHRDFAKRFRPLVPQSAGFIRITEAGRVETYGSSDSLGLKAGKFDGDFFEI